MFSKNSMNEGFSTISKSSGMSRFRKLIVLFAVPILALSYYVVQPAQQASAQVDVYTTPGYHEINGRQWHTVCGKYSSTIVRCFTEIVSGGKWVHNNLTYLPSSRAAWGKNPLANNATWKSSGYQWRTECDTARTGRNGCRSYIKKDGKWVFNNIVMFTTGSTPPVVTVPTNPTTPKPTPKPSTKPTVPTPSPTTPAPTAPAPSPSPTTPSNPPYEPSDGWPGKDNTGVPPGTVLTEYTGPRYITTPNTVISGKVINMHLRIQAPNVRIENSIVNGSIDLRDPKNVNHSFTIVDSEVHMGDSLSTGLMRGNFHANRVEITGGRRGAYCQWNCVIENSWVHAQGSDEGGLAHFSGFRMEQNGVFRHNTITCEAFRGPGTGCSGGLTGYGDFAPIQNNLIENNIFLGGGGGGSSVCAYGGSSGADGGKPYGHLAANIRFIDNVFVRGDNGRCGIHGPIMSFDPTRPGNVWQNNRWDDGTIVNSNGR